MGLSDEDGRLASELEQRNLLPQEQIWALGYQALATGQTFQQVLEQSQLIDAATLSALRSSLVESERSTARLARPAWMGESGSLTGSSDPALEEEDGRGTAVMDSSLIRIPRPPALALNLAPSPSENPVQMPQSAVTQTPDSASRAPASAVQHPLQNSMASGLEGGAAAAQTATGLLSPGQSFGPYEILSELGRGGMGAVYKARHQGLNRLCAVKILVAGRDASSEVLDRFLAEARVAAALDDHPGIVRTLDSGSIDGRYFIAMELVEGTDFASLLKAGKVKARAGARVVADIARALAHAHSRGVVHRDVKPQNILVDRSSIARLADFGCAKAGEDGSTMTGAVVGTLNYMAPEQAEDSRRVDRLVDVYALGAILYHVLTGRPPHVGATATNILTSLATKEPPSPESLDRNVDRALSKIAMRALSRDPKKRYPSAEAMAKAIDSYRDGQPQDDTEPSSNPWKPWILLGISALTLIAITAIFRSSKPQPKAETLSLEIISPPQDSWIREPFVTLRARLSSRDAIVRLGKLSARPDARGEIELIVEASPGQNELLLKLCHSDSNNESLEDSADSFLWRLRLDNRPPEIRLDPFSDKTFESSILLRGELQEESLTRLRVNGKDLPVREGRFECDMLLSVGENQLRFFAEDKAGNKAERLICVTRELPPVVAKAEASQPTAQTSPTDVRSDVRSDVGSDVRSDVKPAPKDPKDPLSGTEPEKTEPQNGLAVAAPPVSIEPPEISDLNIKDGALLGAKTSLDFGLSGGIATLLVNGKATPFTLEDGRCKAEIELSKGATKLEIVVADSKAREARIERRIEVDSDAPVIGLEHSEEKLFAELSRNAPLTIRVRDAHPPASLRWLEASRELPLNDALLRLSVPHEELLKGLSLEAIDLAGNRSVTRLLPPLPLLHDLRAWAGIKAPSSPQKLELQFVAAALAPDFEALGGQVYVVERSRFFVVSFTHKRTGLEFRLIPGGSFTMGADPKDSNAKDTERPAHERQIKPFLLAAFEISNFDFDRIRNPRDLKPNDTHSVDNICFEKARRLIESLRKSGDRFLRLPSEAEWEFAARAGTRGPAFFSKAAELFLALSSNEGNQGRLKRADIIKRRRPNPFGLYDMLSGVEEWVSDNWHDSYKDAPADGSPWGVGEDGLGVLRGGAVAGKVTGPAAWRCSARRSFDRHAGERKEDRAQTFMVGMRLAGSLEEVIQSAARRP